MKALLHYSIVILVITVGLLLPVDAPGVPASAAPAQTYNELPVWLDSTKTEPDVLTAISTKLPKGETDKKALLNMTDPYGYNALMLMASKGYLEAVTQLLEEGADANMVSKNNLRLTALHSAVNGMDKIDKGGDIIRVLLKYNADPSVKNQLGNTPIHDLINVVDLPIRFDALSIMLDTPTGNINEQNASGDTLLSLAVLQGQKDFVSQLMNNPTLWSSINLSIKNKRGQTAAQIAKDFKVGLDDGINEFFNKNTNVIGQGGKVTEVDGKGRTGLMLAMLRDDMPFAKGQIAAGADVNARSANGSTPIHYAVRAERNTVAYVKLILDTKKADVNAINSYGETPLLQLYNNIKLKTADRVQISKLLIENGANALLKDKSGNTLLHIAALVGDVAMIMFLKSPSAAVVKNNKGETPLDLAKKGKVSPQAISILQAEVNNAPR